MTSNRTNVFPLFLDSKEPQAPNRLDLFCIYDKQGKQKAWIQKGFLSSRWLSKEDADKGWLLLDDGKIYQLTMTMALFNRIQLLSSHERARAICSFQVHTNGQRIVVAKLMQRPPEVKVALEGQELEAAIKESISKIY